MLDVDLINNNDISLLNTSMEDKYKVNFQKKYLPGEILMINKKSGILIMTNDFPILIKLGQLEGKKTTDAFTLSKQTNLEIKDIFGN